MVGPRSRDDGVGEESDSVEWINFKLWTFWLVAGDWQVN